MVNVHVHVFNCLLDLHVIRRHIEGTEVLKLFSYDLIDNTFILQTPASTTPFIMVDTTHVLVLVSLQCLHCPYNPTIRKSSAVRPISMQTLTEIKLLIVDKIKHIFLVLVLPTKSVFKH
jgi:hypothetical protein